MPVSDKLIAKLCEEVAFRRKLNNASTAFASSPATTAATTASQFDRPSLGSQVRVFRFCFPRGQKYTDFQKSCYDSGIEGGEVIWMAGILGKIIGYENRIQPFNKKRTFFALIEVSEETELEQELKLPAGTIICAQLHNLAKVIK
jgi:hypothetical protein